MKYYLLESYQDIPKYAEVKMIGHCYDSGHSCYEVEYRGRIYKPLCENVKNSDDITKRYESYRFEAMKWTDIFNKTVMGEK
jgi:hypothetical protein